MGVNLGSGALSALFLGATEVTKAYLGSTEVYSATGASPVTTLTHSFAGPDDHTTIGLTETGQQWQALVGVWGRKQNSAYLETSQGQNVAVVESGNADGQVSVTLSALDYNQRLVFRCVDADDYWFAQAAVGDVSLWKSVAGSLTQVTNTAHTWTAGERITVVLSGDSIAVQINGVEVLTATDATHQAATRHGLGGNSASVTNGLYQDFEVVGSLEVPRDVTAVELWLIGGQSNAEGKGDSATSTAVAVGDAWEYNSALTPGLKHLEDPVGDASTGSMWPSYAAQMVTSRPGTKHIFVEAAVDGSAMAAAAAGAAGHWDVGGLHYDAAVAALDAARTALETQGYTVTFRGVLWCQGERDAQSIDGTTITKAEYKAALEAMIARFRTEYGASMPFWIFRTGRPLSADTAGFQEVRAAQDEVAAADANTHMSFTGAVDFPAESKMTDELHWNQVGLNEGGTEGAVAVAAVLTA